MKGNEIVIGVGAALGLGLLAFYLYMNQTPVVENVRTTRGLPAHLSKGGPTGKSEPENTRASEENAPGEQPSTADAGSAP